MNMMHMRNGPQQCRACVHSCASAAGMWGSSAGRHCLLLCHTIARYAVMLTVLADARAPCARRLWFDNLYLRAVFHNTENPDRDSHYIGLAGMAPLKWPLTGRGARYVTRVTIQGDGVGPTMGIWADENVYAESAPRSPAACCPPCASTPSAWLGPLW